MAVLRLKYLLIACFFSLCIHVQAGGDSTLMLKKVIRGDLASKSVVYSGNGLFFAQNMMYRHTISVYNRAYLLVRTIPDAVKLADYGVDGAKGLYRGAPVEAAFSHKGKYAWISNYQMTGEGFKRPGCDSCIGEGYDISYLYRVNTETFKIENVVKVGSVPKYVAVSPNDKYVLVSNWSSGDVSVVDIAASKEIKRIKAGAFPRGIVIDSKSKYAYVTIMGGTSIMKINLDDFSTSWIRKVGNSPRHLCISSNDSLLYVSLNGEGKIARINLNNFKIDKIVCGGAPRSMVLSDDDKYMYVVNYMVDKVSKINLETFKVTEQRSTNSEPIGITFDKEMKEVWVACYSGSLMVFSDTDYNVGGTYDITWIMDEVTSLYASFSARMAGIADQSLAKNTVKEKPPVRVDTEALAMKPTGKPALKPAAASEIVPKTGEMYVVVGSFKVEANAKRLYTKLKGKGYAATTYRNKTGFLCTAIGSFGSIQAAQETLEKIKTEEKMDGWIYKP